MPATWSPANTPAVGTETWKPTDRDWPGPRRTDAVFRWTQLPVDLVGLPKPLYATPVAADVVASVAYRANVAATRPGLRTVTAPCRDWPLERVYSKYPWGPGFVGTNAGLTAAFAGTVVADAPDV